MGIFHTYDVRGIVPVEFNSGLAYDIARAFASYINKGKVAVGRDVRNSSKEIKDSVIKGLIHSGIDVVDLGLITTPLLYFAVARRRADYGIMITASHNPKEYNGLKFCKSNIVPIYGDELKKIEKIYLNKDFIKGEGKLTQYNIIPEYIKYIEERFITVSLKFVVDAGNGSSGLLFERLASVMNLNYVPLYFSPDGNFPNHHPNPIVEENLEDLKKKVVEEEAEFGVAFDGDADRIGFIDNYGNFVQLDYVIALLSEHELKKHIGETIYYDLRCSKIVEETIIKNKGVPVKVRVGNPFYKQLLIEKGGLFGAELSGHIMFKENYAIDDPIYALLKTLMILKSEGKKFSEVIARYKKYAKSKEINFRVSDQKMVMEEIEEIFKDKKKEFIDGITIYDDNWWFNIRKSNTEPLIRINIEAINNEKLDEIKNYLISIIKKYEVK